MRGYRQPALPMDFLDPTAQRQAWINTLMDANCQQMEPRRHFRAGEAEETRFRFAFDNRLVMALALGDAHVIRDRDKIKVQLERLLSHFVIGIRAVRTDCVDVQVTGPHGLGGCGASRSA